MRVWDPFEDMRIMHEEMEKLFGNFYGKKLLPSEDNEGKEVSRLPVSAIKESEKEIIATFEIPGVDKEGIDLNVTETTLEVKTEQKHENEEKSDSQIVHTMVSNSFYRQMSLPAKVNPNEVKAEDKDGVLKVVMSKADAKAMPKRIEIE